MSTGNPGKKRILVIDDEVELLRPIAEAFRAQGMEVDVLANSLMAESLISKGRYHAIITDFKMAHMDGAAVVKAVRTSLVNRDTPVLVILSFIDKQLLAKLLDLGIQGVMVKPFRSVELVSRVTALFAQAG